VPSSLDRIDADAPRRKFEKQPAKRRRSKAETQAAVVALTEDGLVASAVANRLGLSVKSVREHLRVLQTAL
jgi:DNA-binding NarL/FixJ family response regulator